MSINNWFPHYKPSSNEIIVAADVLRSTNAGSWTKVKEIRIRKSGTYRISFYIYTEDASVTAYGQIFKNGVAYGTLRSTTSTSWVKFIEDLIFSYGDLCQLYIHSAGTNTASASTFQLLNILDFWELVLD